MANVRYRSLLKLFYLVVFLIIIIFGVNYWLNSRSLHIVSTDPTLDNFSNSVPFLDISFNKVLVPSSVSIGSSQGIIKSYSVNKKVIYISLNSLQLNKTYSITIKTAASTDNKKLVNKVLTFTTKYIDFSSLPKDQQQSVLKNQDNYSSPLNDPIVSHLPYQTLNYSLSAQVNKGPNSKPYLVINAEILLSEADMSNEAAAINQDKQAIANYISSLGLNPDKYDIEYLISTP